MLESVVTSGTGTSAAIDGYTVAGKTGTAQIPDPNQLGYEPGAYVGTFAGFAPAQDPVLSAIVVLDHPTPIYGGAVAAPVFSTIMAYALHHYGIPTTSTPTTAASNGGHRRSGLGHRPGRSDHGRTVGARPRARPTRTTPPARHRTSLIVLMDAARPRARPSPASRGDLAATEVTSVEYDSRQVRAGRALLLSPGRQDRRPRLRRRGRGRRGAWPCSANDRSTSTCPRSGWPGRCPAGHGRGGRPPSTAIPASDLTMVGVTGTNGKTTVTHLVAALARARPACAAA